MSRRAATVPAFVSLVLGAARLAAEAPEAAPRAAPRVTVREEDGGLLREVLIEARDGRVAWADLPRALSRMEGFEDAALPDSLPRGSFRLDRLASPFVALPLRLCLPGPIVVRRLPPARAGGEPLLEIRIDRASLEDDRRERKGLLRGAALRALGGVRRFGISGD